ncbi:MAG: hypothetical protein PHY30_03655 [Candidatus Pacebacteria bacterium]|nr:hypothetical protein [Candidatus Paceibacterota bacterium]
MAKTPICPYCKELVNKDQTCKKYQNKTYHMTCYKKMIEEKYKENMGQEDYRKELYEYICDIFKIDEITPQIMSQIDKFYKDYNLTYTEMKDSLYYYTQIMGKTLDIKYGIAIIPHIINEVRQLYEDVKLATELNENVDITKAVKPVKVKIKQPNYSYRKNIDMEDL